MMAEISHPVFGRYDPELICECGHPRKYHNHMGMSENIITGTNCDACRCGEFKEKTHSRLKKLTTEKLESNKVRIHLLPGGKMPERKTQGAIGFDTAIRAVVSTTEMDTTNPILRKTLFDFTDIPKDNPYTERHVVIVPGQSGNQLAYQMDPGESVLVGIGFITEMVWPMFYWVAPRSGLAAKWGITVTNAPGTVDPDYRGEAGVLVYNRNPHPFLLHKDMRIAQVVFQIAQIPDFVTVKSYDELSNTFRGTGGFGSTGIK